MQPLPSRTAQTGLPSKDPVLTVPSWRTLLLAHGVLAEPSPEVNRLILWVPGSRAGGFRHWERISTVPGAAVVPLPGMATIPATSMPARERLRGFFRSLLPLLRKVIHGQNWLLPNGATAEPWGERQTDLVLVWSAGAGSPLDEARVQAHWPHSQAVRRLGEDLFLVRTAAPPAPGPAEAAQPPPRGCPRRQVEQALAAARQGGDRRREALALADLGVIASREGDARSALALLQEALAGAARLPDRALQRDILGNLGIAQLGLGQAPRALELFRQELEQARADADRCAETVALDHLGLACWCLRDYPQALAFYEQALSLCRQLGDWQHEAEVLWYLAILHAERGQRHQAVAHAQAAVDLYRGRGKPQADGLAESLHRYRARRSGFLRRRWSTLRPRALPGRSLV